MLPSARDTGAFLSDMNCTGFSGGRVPNAWLLAGVGDMERIPKVLLRPPRQTLVREADHKPHVHVQHTHDMRHTIASPERHRHARRDPSAPDAGAGFNPHRTRRRADSVLAIVSAMSGSAMGVVRHQRSGHGGNNPWMTTTCGTQSPVWRHSGGRRGVQPAFHGHDLSRNRASGGPSEAPDFAHLVAVSMGYGKCTNGQTRPRVGFRAP